MHGSPGGLFQAHVNATVQDLRLLCKRPEKHSGTSVLKLHLFQKTVQEAIVQNPTLVARERMTDIGISMHRLSGKESRAQVFLDNGDIFSVNNLVKNQVFKNRGLTTLSTRWLILSLEGQCQSSQM